MAILPKQDSSLGFPKTQSCETSWLIYSRNSSFKFRLKIRLVCNCYWLKNVKFSIFANLFVKCLGSVFGCKYQFNSTKNASGVRYWFFFNKVAVCKHIRQFSEKSLWDNLEIRGWIFLTILSNMYWNYLLSGKRNTKFWVLHQKV